MPLVGICSIAVTFTCSQSALTLHVIHTPMVELTGGRLLYPWATDSLCIGQCEFEKAKNLKLVTQVRRAASQRESSVWCGLALLWSLWLLILPTWLPFWCWTGLRSALPASMTQGWGWGSNPVTEQYHVHFIVEVLCNDTVLSYSAEKPIGQVHLRHGEAELRGHLFPAAGGA